MNNQAECCSAGPAKIVVLAFLCAAGLAVGLYLSGAWTATPAAVPFASNAAAPAPLEAALTPTRYNEMSRFPLSAFDVKDTVEAPDLAVGPDVSVFLTWASKTAENERTVMLTRSSDGGRSFEAPRAVSRGGIYKTASKGKGRGGFERRALPHAACVGDRVELTWSEALPDRSAMRLVLASSADGGATFGPAAAVHTGPRPNPTFAGLAAGANGAMTCTWLDDGAGAQQVFAAVRRNGSQSFEAERPVHAGSDGKGVCPCCPTAACIAPDGTVFVAFRNIVDGYRDIFVSRLQRGTSSFEGPFPVVPNTWKFDGCPHDGPSMAVAGGWLHIVWMDARSGSQRCYCASAGLADLKFEASELHAIPAGSQGNAKLYADPAGCLHAVWEESAAAEPAGGHQHHHGVPQVGTGGGRAIMYAYAPAGSQHFESPRALAAKEGAFQTRPTIAGAGNGKLLVAWNELDENGKSVVVMRFDAGVPRHER